MDPMLIKEASGYVRGDLRHYPCHLSEEGDGKVHIT